MRLPPAPVHRYGDHPDQVANLHLPNGGGGGPWPVVVLLHGGFWRERWDRTLTTPLAIDLASRGYAAWNVEYRRVGQEGGGFPGTLDDVSAALALLRSVDGADASRVVAVGHSAGGHLALWLAGRAGETGVRGAVSLAGVADLAGAHADGLGQGAVSAFLGDVSQDELAERLRAASPLESMTRVPCVLVHGADDDIVPPSQSRAYAARARELGLDVELVELEGADHFDVADPGHVAWSTVVEALPRLFTSAILDT